jgi:hypothetical protein
LFATNLQEETLDIVVAPSDLRQAQVLVQGAGRGAEETCPPRYAFAGQFVLIAACVPGSEAATLERFTVDEAGVWQRETLDSSVQGHFAADSTGERVFYIDHRGVGLIADGTERTEVDRNVLWGRFNPEGSTVFYTVGDQLRQKSSNGSPIPIVTVGFVHPVAWTNDLRYVVYSRSVDYEAGLRRDLFVTATDWFNPDPYALADKTVATVSRSALTNDGRYALYLTDIQPSGVGTLNVRPVAGGAGRTFTGVDTAVAANGSLIVFSDNKTEPGVWPVRADLKVFDPNKSDPPELLRAGVLDGRTFQLSADRSKVVYARTSTPEAPGSEGLYLHPLLPANAE